jgi:hypothetical protein
MALYPTAAVEEIPRRFELALTRPLFTFSLSSGLLKGVSEATGSEGWEWVPLDAALVILGIVATSASLVSGWLQSARARGSKLWRSRDGEVSPPGLGPAGITLVWTGVHFGGIAANLGLDWDRYVLSLSVFAALWAGIGIAWVWIWLRALIRPAHLGTARHDSAAPAYKG